MAYVLHSNLFNNYQTCRSKLESLFQPLVDAISFQDAVSDTDDLLESSYSSHAIPRPSCSPPPGSEPQSPTDSPSPAENQPPASQKSSVQSEALPSISNGSTHGLTSAHHTAATLEEIASQAAAEVPATASRHNSAATNVEAREARLQGLLEVYEEPDCHAGLYNYAKALEDVEAGLLAGFFYKHFCLASNVIGSESKGVLPLLASGLMFCTCHLHSQQHCCTHLSLPILCTDLLQQRPTPAFHCLPACSSNIVDLRSVD